MHVVRARRLLTTFTFVCLCAAPAAAQTGQPPSAAASDEWQISDNSFLVEEAFNQEPGIVQHIFSFQRLDGRNWQFSFTEEFPAPGVRHQLSYTLPVQAADGQRGLGDALVNYRLQVLEEGPGRPAFSPRVSAILPSGRSAAGAGTSGVQVNLPFSKRRDRVYVHWNAGVTWQRTAGHQSVVTPAAAASVIYRARQMVNLMLETVVAGVEAPASSDAGAATRRIASTTVAPGVRGGWNLGDDRQLILGAAVPLTRAAGETDRAVLLYLSYEGPFTGLRRTSRPTSASPTRARP
jgi:hypothetical protein